MKLKAFVSSSIVGRSTGLDLHAAITESNAGLQAHRDGPAYWPGVCIVSLGATAVMRFRSKANGEDSAGELHAQQLERLESVSGSNEVRVRVMFSRVRTVVCSVPRSSVGGNVACDMLRSAKRRSPTNSGVLPCGVALHPVHNAAASCWENQGSLRLHHTH